MKPQQFLFDGNKLQLTLPGDSVSQIVDAAIRGDVAFFEGCATTNPWILETKANHGEFEGCSLLYIAIHLKHLELVKFFLKHNVALTACDSGPHKGITPQECAILSNEADLIGLCFSFDLDFSESILHDRGTFKTRFEHRKIDTNSFIMYWLNREQAEKSATLTWYARNFPETTTFAWYNHAGYEYLSLTPNTKTHLVFYQRFLQKHSLPCFSNKTKTKLFIRKNVAYKVTRLLLQTPSPLTDTVQQLNTLLHTVNIEGSHEIFADCLWLNCTPRIQVILQPLLTLPFIEKASDTDFTIPLAPLGNNQLCNLNQVLEAISHEYADVEFELIVKKHYPPIPEKSGWLECPEDSDFQRIMSPHIQFSGNLYLRTHIRLLSQIQLEQLSVALLEARFNRREDITLSVFEMNIMVKAGRFDTIAEAIARNKRFCGPMYCTAIAVSNQIVSYNLIELAAMSGQVDIVRLFIEENAQNIKPLPLKQLITFSVLEQVVAKGHLGVLKLLVEQGALGLSPTKEGDFPASALLSVAMYHKNLAMSTFLLEQGADFTSTLHRGKMAGQSPSDFIRQKPEYAEYENLFEEHALKMQTMATWFEAYTGLRPIVPTSSWNPDAG